MSFFSMYMLLVRLSLQTQLWSDFKSFNQKLNLLALISSCSESFSCYSRSRNSVSFLPDFFCNGHIKIKLALYRLACDNWEFRLMVDPIRQVPELYNWRKIKVLAGLAQTCRFSFHSLIHSVIRREKMVKENKNDVFPSWCVPTHPF